MDILKEWYFLTGKIIKYDIFLNFLWEHEYSEEERYLLAKQKILETIKEHILILMRVCLNQAGRLCEIGGDYDWAGNIFKIKEGYIFKIKSLF